MSHEQSVHSAVEHVLARAIESWEELPEMEREIDTWDHLDQIVYLEEWQIEEDRLLRLAEHAQSGAFTPGQRARYERLLKLVEDHRPIIERLLRS